jgi:putative SOS response-associated peptidase YedK
MRLSTFNARVETVTTKPFFREAFKRTRCIIPASGYYEWQDTPDGKQPHYFTCTDGQVISFAGLWDEWQGRATGETLKSCTMNHHGAERAGRGSSRPHASGARAGPVRAVA